MTLGPASQDVTFTPAGSVAGITLVQHQCTRFGGTWVSPEPSADPEHIVPFCGCKAQEGITPEKEKTDDRSHRPDGRLID